MLRSFLERLGLVGAKTLEQSPQRPSFCATVLAWDAMSRKVDGSRESARSFPVDNFS